MILDDLYHYFHHFYLILHFYYFLLSLFIHNGQLADGVRSSSTTVRWAASTWPEGVLRPEIERSRGQELYAVAT